MEEKTLAKLYSDSFQKNWDRYAFSDYEGNDYKFSQIATKIKSLHLFYQHAGLNRGDRIAVLGRNSSHWGTVFLSALSSGLIIVPVLPDFNEVILIILLIILKLKLYLDPNLYWIKLTCKIVKPCRQLLYWKIFHFMHPRMKVLNQSLRTLSDIIMIIRLTRIILFLKSGTVKIPAYFLIPQVHQVLQREL